MPEWARLSAVRTNNQLERLAQVVNLATQGISRLTMSLEIAEFLEEVEDNSGKSQAERETNLLHAKGGTDLAVREVKEGFPVLHAQAVVTLWAYLESFVRQIGADWILNQPTCLQSSAFDKVKVRVAEYERLDPIDKAYFLVDALERESAAGLQNGTTRFEVLLRSFGLDGEIPSALGRDVFELGQIRNVVMHRAGLVDQKSVDGPSRRGLPTHQLKRLRKVLARSRGLLLSNHPSHRRGVWDRCRSRTSKSLRPILVHA